MVHFESKLPHVGTTIFTVMSKLARDHNAINLSQGFPNFDCPRELKDLVNKYMQAGKNQYAPMGGVPELQKAIADKIQKLYGHQLDPSHEITITSGATHGLYTTISAFIKPGDEVIIFEPAFDTYHPNILVHGGIPKPYRLHKPHYTVDWDKVNDMVTEETRMIIINTPHNPTGKILKQADLEGLQSIVENKNIIILSDEVYEHLVYDGYEHQSVLRYPNLAERSLTVFSFGKTFHSTGWRIGYIVGPEYLMKEFRKFHQFNVFTVNSFIQYALAEYLQEENHYNYLPDFFQQKRDHFQHAMQGGRFKPIPTEGTYFQLYDYEAISNLPDFDFCKNMILENGVAAIPVSTFYSNNLNENIVRFCFAKTEDQLIQAAEILRKM